MPDGILPSEGIAEQLECILKRNVPGILPWQLMLWTNDIEPDCDVEFGDLEEATFDGYTRFDLDRDLWTSPVVDGCCAVSTFTTTPLVWWVDGGPIETIYGYAMIDNAASLIRFIQRFDPLDIKPIEIGSRIHLLPRYTLTSAACADEP